MENESECTLATLGARSGHYNESYTAVDNMVSTK